MTELPIQLDKYFEDLLRNYDNERCSVQGCGNKVTRKGLCSEHNRVALKENPWKDNS